MAAQRKRIWTMDDPNAWRFVPRAGGVYRLWCVETQHEYIGQSKDLQHRFRQHLWGILHGNHPIAMLRFAAAVFGARAFCFEILTMPGEMFGPMYRRQIETAEIHARKPIYNGWYQLAAPRFKSRGPNPKKGRKWDANRRAWYTMLRARRLQRGGLGGLAAR